MNVYLDLYLEFAIPPSTAIPCRRCGSALDPERVCVSSGVFTTVAREGARGASKNMHALCAVDLDAQAVVNLLDRDPLAFDGREALDALARARLAAITEVNRKRKKNEPPPTVCIERARDSKGRPRVRVIFTGSYAHNATGGHKGPEALFVDQTLASARNEFEFVRHTSLRTLAVDPSQPWAAAVYWQNADEGIASSRRAQVIEWAALALPPPIIVLTGRAVADAEARDAFALALRKMIARAGVEADECPVLCAVDPDEAFVAELALALDERVELAAPSNDGDRDQRLIEQLESVVERGNTDAIGPALRKIAPVYRRARVADKERITGAIVRAAALPLVSAEACDAMFSLRLAKTDPYFALAKALFDNHAKLSSRIDNVIARWSESPSDPESLPSLLVAVLLREKHTTARAQAAAHWLPVIATQRTHDELRAHHDDAATPRAKRALIAQALEKARKKLP